MTSTNYVDCGGKGAADDTALDILEHRSVLVRLGNQSGVDAWLCRRTPRRALGVLIWGQISVIEPIAQTATRRFNSLVLVVVHRPSSSKNRDEDEDEDEKTGIESALVFKVVKAFH